MVDELITLEIPFDNRRQIVAIITIHDVLAIGIIFEIILNTLLPLPLSNEIFSTSDYTKLWILNIEYVIIHNDKYE